MKHPWEDVTLTPSDLKKMVRNGLYTEKIDGFGVQFRFNDTTKKFHLIRNKAHIDRGGLDGTAIMSEYAGKDAGIAFWIAYNLINQPYLLYTVDELLKKTGGGELRVIGDIVYKDITNIIKYDAPFFAVHAITLDDIPLKVESFPWPKGFVVGHQVRVCGVDMNVVEGMIESAKAHSSFGDRISPTKLDYNKTFEEIYREEFDRHWDSNILLYDELPIVKELMFRRMIGDKNASLKDIKDLSKNPEVIGALDKKLGSLFIECTTPVREIVTRIGSYLKEHAHSTLGKGYGMMEEMTRIPNYSVPTLDNIFEGLVFEYEGKTFKWTGSFGMYNKLYWDKIKNGTAY